MPTLEWIGKEKVINHHQEVPFRVLERQYSFDENGQTAADNGSGNMIIRGDNLEALKALLPRYEGRVKCIYIDPPYNTGNEGWVYNDNVNDPKIRKWLGEVVGKEGEDLTRHDKWLCMMYPRLKLLHKLLAEDGAIFISIDDNEQANLKLICNEIFGIKNFAAQIIWEKVYSPRMDETGFSTSHDYILCYVKQNLDAIKREAFEQRKGQFNFLDIATGKSYRRRSVRKEGSQSLRSDRPNLFYPLIAPDGTELFPIKPDGTEGRWRWSPKTYKENLCANLVEWVRTNNGWQVYAKQFLDTEAFRPPVTLWKCEEVGHNHSAAEELKAIFECKVFDNPKPKELIQKIISLVCDSEAIILDSFAGSGTTAHAVLNMNKSDGGNRKFILVEMMDYAETITAERVRRVINGYGEGKNAVEGTGGSFSFYELGEPLLIGENLNESVGAEKIREYVWFTETKLPYTRIASENPYYLGTNKNAAYYFYYEPQRITVLDHQFLSGIRERGETTVIYADRCAIGSEKLSELGILFKKIPRDISRL